MGLFIRKEARKALGDANLTGSYAVIALCVVLVVVNIIMFMLFGRMLAPLAILLSNVVTMLIMVLAFRPVNSVIQHALEERQEELLRQAEQQKLMERKMSELESRNLELEGKLEARTQTAAAPADVNFTFKLEQMEYSKQGYVVREDRFESLLADAGLSGTIPDKGVVEKLLETLKLKEAGMRKILYVKKFYYKASVGIDFTRIKFALSGDTILFSGVKFSRLHDISSELEPDASDISHTWVLDETEGRTAIIQSSDYDALKEAYARLREADTREALETELDSMCRQYTEAFRASLRERFAGVDFVDCIDDDNSWFSLQEVARSPRAAAVASNMLMLTDVLGRTRMGE